MKLALLILAIVFFLLAAFSAPAFINWIDWGFVAFAASFLPLPN